MSTTATGAIVHTTPLQRLVHHTVAALRDTTAAWQRSRRRRALTRALDALDDRTLADIGFARSEVDSVAAELAGIAPATRCRVLRR